jgi:hypothetical protein
MSSFPTHQARGSGASCSSWHRRHRLFQVDSKGMILPAFTGACAAISLSHSSAFAARGISGLDGLGPGWPDAHFARLKLNSCPFGP